jgi:hypothetical protein
MKTLLFLILCFPLLAQSSEPVLYVAGSVAAFSLFDYVGYNIAKSDATSLTVYRIVQVAVQAGLSYFLYDQCGLPAAISFNLIWWTFGVDWAYYGWAELLNPSGRWESRGVTHRATYPTVRHGTWTAGSIVAGRPLTQREMIAQSVIGLSLSFIIL